MKQMLIEVDGESKTINNNAIDFHQVLDAVVVETEPTYWERRYIKKLRGRIHRAIKDQIKYEKPEKTDHKLPTTFFMKSADQYRICKELFTDIRKEYEGLIEISGHWGDEKVFSIAVTKRGLEAFKREVAIKRKQLHNSQKEVLALESGKESQPRPIKTSSPQNTGVAHPPLLVDSSMPTKLDRAYISRWSLKVEYKVGDAYLVRVDCKTTDMLLFHFYHMDAWNLSEEELKQDAMKWAKKTNYSLHYGGCKSVISPIEKPQRPEREYVACWRVESKKSPTTDTYQCKIVNVKTRSVVAQYTSKVDPMVLGSYEVAKFIIKHFKERHRFTMNGFEGIFNV